MRSKQITQVLLDFLGRRNRRKNLAAISISEALENRLLLTGPHGPDPGGSGSDPYGGGGSDPGSGGTGAPFGELDGLTLRPVAQEWFTNFGTEPLTGSVSLARDLPGNLNLEYRSDTDGLPIVIADTEWDNASAPTGPVEARLLIGGVQHASVFLDGTGLQQGDEIRVALAASTALPTGRHSAEVQFLADVGSGTTTSSVTQELIVENRNGSVFGEGWALAGLEQLALDTSGAVYTNGFGLTTWYEFNSSGDGTALPDPGAMSNSPLTENTDGTYTLDHNNGGSSDFDANGRLATQTDIFGNTTTYNWDAQNWWHL